MSNNKTSIVQNTPMNTLDNPVWPWGKGLRAVKRTPDSQKIDSLQIGNKKMIFNFCPFCTSPATVVPLSLASVELHL